MEMDRLNSILKKEPDEIFKAKWSKVYMFMNLDQKLIM